ncbi:MAG: hypothetical protein K0R53_3523 [Burkholderiales bacterium]|jgi:hypothetical protein|nr:hypothetical protein [Burkholderiales bacterium]
MAEILEIDVSKRTFDCALLLNAKFKPKVFENTEPGSRELDDWVKRQSVARAQPPGSHQRRTWRTVGLTPRQHLSGSSVRGRARLSKTLLRRMIRKLGHSTFSG